MTEEQENVVIKCRNSGLGYGAIARGSGWPRTQQWRFVGGTA